MPRRILWVDTETTGLDPIGDALLEIAAVVTDWDLNIVAEPFQKVIAQDNDLVSYLREEIANDYVREMHDKTGLWDRVKKARDGMYVVERQFADYFIEHTDPTSPLAGNSITHDRNFLRANMPQAYDWIYYRSIDVSSIAQAAQAWYGPDVKYEKKKTHEALSDIQESIEELRYLRKQVFVNGGKSII